MMWKRQTAVTEFCLLWSAFMLGGSHYCLSFITEPKDQVAQLRNFVTLYCTVNITSLTSAGETQSIEWYRNQTGRPPPGSVINTTWGDVELESVLTFPTGSYYGDFQGLYHCAVTSQNSNVRIRSRDALIVAQRITSLLRIYGRNESFVTVPSNETVVVVQRGYFLESSEPIWNVVCFSNSSLQFGLRGILHDFSQDRRLESQSLLFASLQDLQHVTSTTCTSFVIESMVATSNHSVYIEFSDSQVFEPRLVGPFDTSAIVGSNVTLICTGNSNTSYLWTKDGHIIDTGRHARLSNPTAGVLQIVNVSEQDSGVYNCCATIGSYQKCSFAPLTVSAPPSVSLSVSRNAVTVDKQIYWNVTCDTLGARPLVVSVLFNAAVQKQVTLWSNTSSLVLYTVGLTDSGYIQCLVSNNFGSSQQGSYVHIVPQGTPTPTLVLPSEDTSASHPTSTAWVTSLDASRNTHTSSSNHPDPSVTTQSGCSTSLCSTRQTNHPALHDSDDLFSCLGVMAVSGALAGYAVLLVVIVILVCMLCQKRKRETQLKEIINSKAPVESCTVHSNTVYNRNYESPSRQGADQVYASGSLTDGTCTSTRNDLVYDVPIVSKKPALSQLAAGYQVPRSCSVSQEFGLSHEYSSPSELNKIADGPSTDSDCYVTMQAGYRL